MNRYKLELNRDLGGGSTWTALVTGFESEKNIDKLLAEKIISTIDQCRSAGDLTRTITLPPPDEGYQWSDYPAYPVAFQKYFCAHAEMVVTPEAKYSLGKYYVQIPIRRTYDWSKTGPDVLVRVKYAAGFMHLKDAGNHSECKLPEIWQAHDFGRCPIDGGCSIVSVRLDNGEVATGMLSSGVSWDCVSSWKFERLIDADWS